MEMLDDVITQTSFLLSSLQSEVLYRLQTCHNDKSRGK
jgi:hypothetical protein